MNTMKNQNKVLLNAEQLEEFGSKLSDITNVVDLMTISIDNLDSSSDTENKAIYAYQADKLLENHFYLLQIISKELDKQGITLMNIDNKRELEALGYVFDEN